MSSSLSSRRAILTTLLLTAPILSISGLYTFHLITFLFGVLTALLLTDTLLWDILRFVVGTLPQSEIPVQFTFPASEVAGFKYQYGLDHALLNARLDTLWLNMGYWKEARGFQEACEGWLCSVYRDMCQTCADR